MKSPRHAFGRQASWENALTDPEVRWEVGLAVRYFY